MITREPSQPVATRPLAIRKDGTWFAYGWDLTKNICEVYGQHGHIRTFYTYTPMVRGHPQGMWSNPSSGHDAELGLAYYNWRYYNPKNGRWISCDFIHPSKPESLYEYVENAPISDVDILGLKTDKSKQEIEEEINSTDAAKKMKQLIESHMQGRDKVTECGKGCSKLTVITEFGDPNAWFPYVGHASLGIDDTFLDYGPHVGKRPNPRIIDKGGTYYNSEGYKNKNEKISNIDTTSVRDVTNNIEKFSTGFVLAAHICICKNTADKILERMKSLTSSGTYSIPGQQCASTVYAAIYDTKAWSKACLSPQGLMLRFVRQLKHECGSHKGKLGYLESIII